MDSKIVENLGWVLLHSIWQIALIAFILFFFLQITRRFSAHTRYLISVSALVCAAALPVFTYVYLTQNAGSKISRSNISTEQNAGQAAINRQLAEDFPAFGKPGGQSENPQPERLSLANLQAFLNNNSDKILPVLVGVWLFGIALFSIRLIGGVWQLHRFKTREVSEISDEWQKRFATICANLKITQPVKILQSNLVEMPMAMGWLKPLILVPASIFLQISPRELETIFAHELVHIRRYDFLVNFAQSVIEILFFYHPGIWWISSKIRSEREFACDDAVMKILANSKIDYAKALMNLEEIKSKKLMPLVATAANGGILMQRIQRILQKNTEIKQSLSAWSAGSAFVLISAVLVSLFSVGSTSLVNAESKLKTKKLAIGFVSIPPLDRTENPPKDADATARLMISKLTQHKIPAVGFVQGVMISDGEKLYPVRADIVRLWRDAGLEIGIGNYKHVWFYDTPFSDYIAGVEKNERITKKVLAEKDLPLRYFSYPFLNTGKNVEDKNRFEAWLQGRGLTSVKYTVDNQEWMYSYAYDAARNDNDVNTMKQVRTEFMDYMAKMFDHYEAYSNEMFGRDINQTMVLTPSRLVADSADELFGMLEKRGYQFVSMEDALKDEAYQTKEAHIDSKSGISWFERWQLAQGKKLRDEPKVSALVDKMWKQAKK